MFSFSLNINGTLNMVKGMPPEALGNVPQRHQAMYLSLCLSVLRIKPVFMCDNCQSVNPKAS